MEKTNKTTTLILAALSGMAGMACVVVASAWSTGGIGRGHVDAVDRVAAINVPSLQTRASSALHEPLRPDGSTLVANARAGLLTLHVRDALLSDALSTIGRTADIRFDGVADDRERVSIDAGPLPVKDAVSTLLDRTSYGYAFIEDAAYRGAWRVVLVKRGVAGDTTSAPRPVAAPSIPAQPDDAALQEQRAADALLDACRSSACDSS